MMNKPYFLDFENDLKAIHEKIETCLAHPEERPEGELTELETQQAKKTAELYRTLNAWQTTQVARHPNRPQTLDYINTIFDDFTELHGDRHQSDDASIVGGLAHLGHFSVMVIGHQKGHDTRERTRRNFGMSCPEGYRKALRLMRLAAKFKLPVITFIDTPGAYPGIEAELGNQAEAIGRCIFELTRLPTPVIATVIGEGGSGGALALAVADCVMMLQYAVYSVISPEGCASILWKDASQAKTAAEALSLTSERLLKLGLIDRIISEPIGGAHRDIHLMSLTLKKSLIDRLSALYTTPIEALLEKRYQRLMHYGVFEETRRDEPVAPADTKKAPLEIQKTVEKKKENNSKAPEKKVKRATATSTSAAAKSKQTKKVPSRAKK